MSQESSSSSAVIDRYNAGPISVSIVKHGEFKEYFVALDLFGIDDAGPVLRELFFYFEKEGAKIVQQMIFGDCLSKRTYINKMKEIVPDVNWPIMALENDVDNYSHLTGMQFIAIAGVELIDIRLREKIVGYTFEDKTAKYIYLADVRPENIINNAKDQTKDVYKRVTQALGQADMDFSNVVRTWFYLDRLLDWYGVFNEARINFYNSNSTFEKLVPASTGIGARNKERASLDTGYYAIKPKDGSTSIMKVDSPMQCEAFNYKSAFSRAVEIKTGNIRKLIISGTASISEDGKSVHMGYINKQIEMTMDIVNKILLSRKMSWENVTRAIVYYKESDGGSLYKEYCHANKIPPFPTAFFFSSVCRDELLFEIELDAVAAG